MRASVVPSSCTCRCRKQMFDHRRLNHPMLDGMLYAILERMDGWKNDEYRSVACGTVSLAFAGKAS